jgi:hypothetical protein
LRKWFVALNNSCQVLFLSICTGREVRREAIITHQHENIKWQFYGNVREWCRVKREDKVKSEDKRR